MSRPLLVVTDTFAIRGLGLVLAPGLPLEEATAGPVDVEVERPDGERRAVRGRVEIPMVHPTPAVVEAAVVLLDVTKEDVPIGSKIWVRG